MKSVIFLTGLWLMPIICTADNLGKVCMNIPERGVELVKIAHNCKKGDIIEINKLHIPALCDFSAAIVNYDGHDRFICAYLGEKREAREGTN